MKKGVAIAFVCLSIFLLVSIPIVSAGWFDNFWAKITGDVVITTCTDQGNNLMVKEKCTNPLSEGGIILWDRCSDDLVQQVECVTGEIEDVCGYVAAESCSAGYECSDGACVEGPAVCGNGVIESGEECDDGNIVNGDGCSNNCIIVEEGLWLGQQNGELKSCDTNGNCINQGDKGESILSMAVFADKLWIGQSDGALQSCNELGECTFNGDKGESILSMAVFADKLWIGESDGRLKSCDSSGDCIDYGDKGNGIISMAVYNNKLWIGKSSSNIDNEGYLQYCNELGDCIDHHLPQRASVYSMAVYDNKLWMGQWWGKLSYCDGNGNCTMINPGDRNDDILSMAVYNDMLWLGLFNGGVEYCDNVGNCIVRSVLNGFDIRPAIVFDNKIWFGKEYGGLLSYGPGRQDYGSSGSSNKAMAIFVRGRFCGNGLIENDEQCDLGNNNGVYGYGCDSGCNLNSWETCEGTSSLAWLCTSDLYINNTDNCNAAPITCDWTGSECISKECSDYDHDSLSCNTLLGCYLMNNSALCGNGVIESGEECDDGNIVNGDGCSSICQIESVSPTCVDEGNDLMILESCTDLVETQLDHCYGDQVVQYECDVQEDLCEIANQGQAESCPSGSACSEGACVADPYAPIGDCEDDECFSDGLCYPLGFRLGGDYCTINGQFEDQLNQGSCNNYFECSSNLCIDGECVEQGIFRIFLRWFRGLFS